ncbi:putative pantothenate transporter [Atractiella rhizophila]|nr:putative pantothenate transporter [Atractiella rhizophila]
MGSIDSFDTKKGPQTPPAYVEEQPLPIEVVQVHQERLTAWGLVKEIFDWYPKRLPEEERKLLFKLDLSLLIYGCLSFFVKFLDQTNITNAYVSGMREDLKLFGNELNYLNQFYYGGYVVAQIPMLMFMTRPSLARYWLPLNEVIYGVLTFVQSKVTDVRQLYAIRTLVGVFEAPTFAGTHFVFGSWYKKEELFKRAGTWFICNSMGSMFSGYLQSAAYTNLNGTGGLEGWRWLFIIDGIITIPIAFFGFVVFPGIPESPKTIFFSDEAISLSGQCEIALGKRRMVETKVARPGPITLDVVKRTLKRWHWWVGVAIYICLIQSGYGNSYMALWLKSLKRFTVPQVNNIPSATYGLSALSSWLGTSLATIYPPILIWTVVESIELFSFICLLIWHIPIGLKFFNWISFGVAGCISPILYSWINIVCKEDAEERAFVISSMMTIGYSGYIWLPLFTFPTVEAPRWAKGWSASIAFLLTMWGLQVLGTTLHKRELKRALAGKQAVEIIERAEEDAKDDDDGLSGSRKRSSDQKDIDV